MSWFLRRLTFTTMLLVTFSVYPALGNCTKKNPDDSPTCWRPIVLEPYVRAIIEISQRSLPFVEKLMMPSFYAGKEALGNISEAMKELNIDSIAVYSTLDAVHNHMRNDDCSMYRKSDGDGFDQAIHKPLIFSSDCSEAVGHLLRAVTSVEDFVFTLNAEDVQTQNPSDLGWQTLLEYAKKTQFVKAELARNLHGGYNLTNEDFEELSHEVDPSMAAFYRVVYSSGLSYIVREHDTLWTIAESFTGDGSNFQQIGIVVDEPRPMGSVAGTAYRVIFIPSFDPDMIVAGRNVRIPVRPDRWNKYLVSESTIDEVGQELYGFDGASQLIERLCPIAGVEMECWLPIFHDATDLGALWDLGLSQR